MPGFRNAERVQFPAGFTKWGQKLTLIGEREGNGEISWSLKKDALNQRDQDDIIRGIGPESIRKMMSAIEEAGR